MLDRVRLDQLGRWSLFSVLDKDFLSELAYVCVYGNLGNECIMVTKDDRVFSMGSNGAGCLGTSDMLSTLFPREIEALSKKEIKTFTFGSGPHVLALSASGEIFSWGHNGYNQLGVSGGNQSSVPTLIQGPLTGKFVTKIACGSHHSVAVTNEGEIFAWGQNNCGQIGAGCTTNQTNPRRVTTPFSDKKIGSVACGQTSTLVALETGEVYGWGFNGNGQLGLNNNINQLSPCRVTGLNGTVISKVQCGYAHSLALSDEGELFAWGANSYGQLGTGNKANLSAPVRIASDLGRIVDVGAIHYSHVSAAVLDNGNVYMWGQCQGQSVVTPMLTRFSHISEVFACFSVPSVTPSPLEVEISEALSLADSFKTAFDDPETSDLKLIVESKPIHVHKSVLKIRCRFFRSMLQKHWEEGNKDEIAIEHYGYDVYKAFLEYLYSDRLNLAPEDAVNLLDLATAYCETELKKRCESLIRNSITVDNAARLLDIAQRYDCPELEEYCFKFALNHMTQLVQTEEFRNLNGTALKDFIGRAAKEGAFKT